MTQDEIRAIALEVAKETDARCILLQAGFGNEWVIDFATRFLAAIAAKAEPMAWFRTVNGIKAGITWDKKTPDIEGWLEFPLFANPAIEPAGKVVVTTTEEGRCVCVTWQDEEGRILKVLWEAPAIEPTHQQASRDLQHEHTMNQFKEVCHGRNCKANKAQPTHSNECKDDHDEAVGAAPLPDGVQETITWLRDNPFSYHTKNAADMLECLARERDQLREVEQQRDELLAALESALEIVTTDRCDGESFFAHGVNAACEHHAIGIRNIIAKVKK